MKNGWSLPPEKKKDDDEYLKFHKTPFREYMGFYALVSGYAYGGVKHKAYCLADAPNTGTNYVLKAFKEAIDNKAANVTINSIKYAVIQTEDSDILEQVKDIYREIKTCIAKYDQDGSIVHLHTNKIDCVDDMYALHKGKRSRESLYNVLISVSTKNIRAGKYRYIVYPDDAAIHQTIKAM